MPDGNLRNSIEQTDVTEVKLREDAKIQLATGEMFAPLAPDASLITMEAITRGLSNTCRFGGQVRSFYSVAQHSVLVAVLSPQDHEAQKYALLHDAEEAFGLPDIPTPLKPFFAFMVEAQAEIGAMAFRAHGVNPGLKSLVKPFDTLALSVEKRDLKDHRDGYLVDLPSPPDWIEIKPLGPHSAEILFRRACRRVFRDKLAITPEWILDQPGFQRPRMAA